MENQYIDLRSDTTSLPDKQTVYSMLEAEVGDFAYGEDRACNDLVEYCKELFKVEDAIFVTSGMLANRLAIITQTMPGDELITHYNYHINFFDSAGNAKVRVLSHLFFSSMVFTQNSVFGRYAAINILKFS